MLEPGEISRAISVCREEGADVRDNAGFRKMVRLLNEQLLVAGYADLN
jgi:hypothetical protein